MENLLPDGYSSVQKFGFKPSAVANDEDNVLTIATARRELHRQIQWFALVIKETGSATTTLKVDVRLKNEDGSVRWSRSDTYDVADGDEDRTLTFEDYPSLHGLIGPSQTLEFEFVRGSESGADVTINLSIQLANYR